MLTFVLRNSGRNFYPPILGSPGAKVETKMRSLMWLDHARLGQYTDDDLTYFGRRFTSS